MVNQFGFSSLGGFPVEAISGNNTLRSNRRYLYDATLTVDDLTLPPSPSLGDRIQIVHTAGDIEGNMAVIKPNGNPINGTVADYDWNVSDTDLELSFDGTGWTLIQNEFREEARTTEYNNTGTDLISTEVQSAITELDARQFDTDTYTATAAQTVFTLTQVPKKADQIEMFVNGITYFLGDDFTLSGVTVTWINTLYVIETGDTVKIKYLI